MLDPFAGTGTTAEAALRENFRAILIEQDDESAADIALRLSQLHATRAERRALHLRRRSQKPEIRNQKPEEDTRAPLF